MKCEECLELASQGILFDLLLERLKRNDESATDQDLIQLYHNNDHNLFAVRKNSD